MKIQNQQPKMISLPNRLIYLLIQIYSYFTLSYYPMNIEQQQISNISTKSMQPSLKNYPSRTTHSSTNSKDTQIHSSNLSDDKPEVPSKKYFNPFNQAHNFSYIYKQPDINIIVQGMIHRAGLNSLCSYVPVGMGIVVNQEDFKMFKQKKGFFIVGIFSSGSLYTAYKLFWQQDGLVCSSSNLTNQLKIELQKLGIKAQAKARNSPNNIFDNSAIEALREVGEFLNLSECDKKPTNLLSLSYTQKFFSRVYLSYKQQQHKLKIWSDWHKLTQHQKRSYLCEINPLTPSQFQSATKLNNDQLNEQVGQLLRYCIDSKDCGYMRVVLRMGVVVGEISVGNRQDRISIGLVSYVEKQFQKCLKDTDQYDRIGLIRRLVLKYGYSQQVAMVTVQNQKIKQEQYSQIVKKVSKQNSAPLELYISFINLLKSYLNSKITGILAATSHEVVMNAGTVFDEVTSKILGKIPYIGANLQKTYNLLVYVCEAARKQHLMHFFSSPLQIEEIINDFAYKIVENYGQEIVNPIQKSLLARITIQLKQKIKDYSIRFRIKHEFTVGGQKRGYGIDWQILCHRYLAQFLTFFTSQEVVSNYAEGNSLGARAAAHLFQFKKVTKTQLQSMEWAPNYDHRSCCTLAKLLLYIEQYHRYPRSLATSPDSFWLDSEIHQQNNQLQTKIKSILTVDSSKITIAFHINQHITPNNHISSLANLKTSKNVIDLFNNFIDMAIYENMLISDNVCFANLLDNTLKKHQDKKIMITGYRLGGVFAALTRVMLINEYKINADRITSYTFQQIPWCNVESLQQAYPLFQHHYQIQLPIHEQASTNSKYTRIGKIFNLANKLPTTNKPQNFNSLSDYINNLQIKPTSANTLIKQQQTHQNNLQFPKQQSALTNHSKKEKTKYKIQQICEQTFLKLIKQQQNPAQIISFINIQPSDIQNFQQENIQIFSALKQQFLSKIYNLQLTQFCVLSSDQRQGNKRCQIIYYLLTNKLLNTKSVTLEILNYASNSGHLYLVKYCVEKMGIGVNQQSEDSGPLIQAILGLGKAYENAGFQGRQMQVIRYLVQQAKADVNFKIQMKNSQSSGFIQKTSVKIGVGDIYPMAFALQIGHAPLVKYLVSKGCDLNTFNFRLLLSNYDAISLALRPILTDFYSSTYATNKYNKLQLLKYLVEEKGFKIKLMEGAGLIGNYQKIQIDLGLVKYMVDHGFDPNYNIKSMGMTTDTLLLLAIRQKDIKLVEYLLKKGADPNFNVTGYAIGTAVHCVCCQDGYGTFTYSVNMNMLKLLLRYKGRLDIPISGLISRFGHEEYRKRLNQTPLDFLIEERNNQDLSVVQYFDILKLQGKVPGESLTFQDFTNTSQFLHAQGYNYYSICGLFASQFLEFESSLTQQNATDKKITKLRLAIDKLKLQFFQGNHKLQILNKAMKILFSYHNPRRFDQVLQICQKFLDDDDFLFLKCIVYIELMYGTDRTKSEHFKKIVRSTLLNIKLPPEYSNYLSAEIFYFEGNRQLAVQFYNDSSNSNPLFLHPKIKLINLTSEIGIAQHIVFQNVFQNFEQKFKSSLKKISTEILPIDLRMIMQNIYERIQTNQVLKEKTIPEKSSFNQSLNQSFSVDVRIVRQYLERIIPSKIYTLTINYEIKGKIQTLHVKKFIKSLDYAYNLLESQSSKTKQSLNHRQSSFFNKLTQAIIKLEALKKSVQHKCNSKRDFKQQRHQEIILHLIEDLVNYYEEYISKVIRNYCSDQDCNYLNFFYKSRGKQLDVCQRIRVFTQRRLISISDDGAHNEIRGPYLLKNQASQNLTVSVPKTDQMYGTHKVVVLPSSGTNQIFYKYEPYAPGIEFAVGSLYNLILPNSAPQTMLVKLTDGSKSGLYLASKAVAGRNFAETINQAQLVRLIDMKNFSSLFLASFLVCTGDAKPDNFVMRFNYDSKGLVSTSLASIDNDIAFYRNKLKVFEKGKKLYSDMLNILYLMPQMDEPVSPYLREYFKRDQNQPEIIISKWLRSLHQKNEHYQKMNGFNEEDFKKLKIPIKLPSGTACMMYSTLIRITKLLKSQNVTHAQIFQSLSPSLAYFYNKCRDNTSIINSLKNIYAAAGADPSILASLYSIDKIQSSKAWNTLSASKRRDNNQFHKIFNSDITSEAESFISCIDFSKKNKFVVQTVATNLLFVNKLVLHNIQQINYDFFVNNFLNTEKNLQIKNKKVASSQKIKQIQKNSSLQVNSIWDIFNLPKIPNSLDLIKSIKIKNINPNQMNQEGNTVLHTAVQKAQTTEDYSKIQKMISVFLDCGVNPKLKNNQNKTCLDLAEKVPYIVITIFSHKPFFFQSLIRNGLLQEAQIIAKSTNYETCTEVLDGELVGQQSSVLKDLLSNKQMKNIATLILTKLQNNCFLSQELLSTFIQNYEDKDLDLLNLMLKNGLKPTSMNQLGQYPADFAIKLKKYNMAVTLLNQKGLMTVKNLYGNENLVVKAAKFGIKLDLNDVVGSYDVKKVNNNNETVFELMAKAKDKELLLFKQQIFKISQLNIIEDYKEKLLKIAFSCDFCQLLQLLHEDKESLYGKQGHILAKNEQIQKLSKILIKYNLKITIFQARNSINFTDKFDKKGNTVLQVIIKDYIHDPDSQKLANIHTILNFADENYINQTARADKNTLFHLLIRARQKNLVKQLWNQYHHKIDLAITNCSGQTIIDYSIQYFQTNLFQTQQKFSIQQVLGNIEVFKNMEFNDILLGKKLPKCQSELNLIKDLNKLMITKK